MSFNKDIPTAGTSLQTSNPQLLANQTALQAALDQDHEFTNASASAQSGKHQKITLMEQTSPGATSTNEGALYSKDAGTQPELCYTSEDGTEKQITSGGLLNIAEGDLVNVLLDEDDMATDSATKVPSQQSVKAYVDSGTVTMTNKTLTSPVLNTGVSGTAVLDEDDMASDSATQLATQQSIKAYVDSQVKVFGDWETKATGTTYTATTDGFAVAFTNGPSAENTLTGLTPVATTRIKQSTGGYSDGIVLGFTMPVKSGDTWRVNVTGTGATASVFWIPFE